MSAPFGFNFGAVPVQPYERYFGLLFSMLVDEIFAYNFLILASFALSGMTMYYLAYHVTRNKAASFISGLVYAFSPFHLAMSMQYIPLASIQWIPLFVLCLLKLYENRDLKSAVWAGLSFALLFLTSYYYGVYVMAFVASFAVFVAGYLTIRAWRRGEIAPRLTENIKRVFQAVFSARNVKAALVVCIVVLVIIIPMTYRFLGHAGSTSQAYGRPLNETIRYSVRPWSLFLPTLDNPVFGRYTSGFIQNHLYDCPVTEQSVYLGMIPVFLALFGLWSLRKEKNEKKVFNVLLFLFSGFVALIFAIGPYIPLDPINYYPHYADVSKIPKIPSISLLLYKIAPMFRFFSRFDVLIVLSLALLAGAGAAYLFERLKTVPVKAGLILCVLTPLIFMEYANVPPFHNIDLGNPPKVYTWLARQPGDLMVVEYPYGPTMSPRSLYYSFYQRVHEKRIVNFPFGDKAIAAREKIKDIRDPNTPEFLRGLGVDYVIIHTKLPPRTYPPYQPVLPDDSIPDPHIKDGYGLVLKKRFSDALVYKVVEPARKFTSVIVSPDLKFAQPERWSDGKNWRWIQDGAQLTAKNYGNNEVKIDITFNAVSFKSDRTLRLLVNGTTVAERQITAKNGTYDLRSLVLKPGTNTITFDTDPGSVTIDSVAHNGDMRKVSIAVSNISATFENKGIEQPMWLEPPAEL
jgi:hypothetical protein